MNFENIKVQTFKYLINPDDYCEENFKNTIRVLPSSQLGELDNFIKDQSAELLPQLQAIADAICTKSQRKAQVYETGGVASACIGGVVLLRQSFWSNPFC